MRKKKNTFITKKGINQASVPKRRPPRMGLRICVFIFCSCIGYRTEVAEGFAFTLPEIKKNKNIFLEDGRWGEIGCI